MAMMKTVIHAVSVDESATVQLAVETVPYKEVEPFCGNIGSKKTIVKCAKTRITDIVARGSLFRSGFFWREDF